MTDFDYETSGDAEHWQPSDYKPAGLSAGTPARASAPDQEHRIPRRRQGVRKMRMTDKDRAEIASYMKEAKGALANLYICIHESCTRQEVKPVCRGCKPVKCMRIIAEQLKRLEKMYIGGSEE